MEAIIREKTMVQNFQLPLRTMTNAVMEDTTMVRMVAQTVMIREFPNTVQKFIFCIAWGKLERMKPLETPTRLRGLRVISALSLNTLMMTIRKGKIKQMKRTSSTIHMMV